jgi:hypothetical protein
MGIHFDDSFRRISSRGNYPGRLRKYTNYNDIISSLGWSNACLTVKFIIIGVTYMNG